MKKILLVISLAASGLVVNAQSFNIGLGGGIYSTWLTNKNVSDAGDELDFAVTFGGQIGLNTSYYFKDNLGLSLALLYTGHNQKYTGEYVQSGVDFSYTAKTKMRYLDIPLLLRMGGGGKGAYFEFGPQFTVLMSAKDDYTASVGGVETSLNDVDVKSTMKGGGVAAILGFGVDIDASEVITVTSGLRLGYCFSDVTKEYTMDQLNDLDVVAFPTANANAYDNSGNSKYKATNRAFGGLFLGVSYKIPMKGGSKGAPVPDTK